MTFSHLKQTNGKCVEEYTSVELINEKFNVIFFLIFNISIRIYRRCGFLLSFREIGKLCGAVVKYECSVRHLESQIISVLTK